MVQCLVNGAKGRMGQALIEALQNHPGMGLAAGVDLGDDVRPLLGRSDVVIDFSSHSATAALAELCGAQGKPMVIGTTGHTDREREAILAQTRNIPMVWASNFSTGVNVLFHLAECAARVLRDGFDPEIIELHHRFKTDAPSGTARTLAEIVAAARKKNPDQVSRHGREGQVGKRTEDEIGVHAVRGGDAVGDHTLMFAGLGERIELTHRATSRQTFAQGALRAAAWVTGQRPGLYDMRDVLGLKAVSDGP